MFPLTHLLLNICPNVTSFDIIFVDSPIFNKNIVHGITNMIQWKYSITTTNSNKGKGSIDTTICLKESLVNGKVKIDS